MRFYGSKALQKKVEPKCMQVNVLKSVTRMKKKYGGIQTD